MSRFRQIIAYGLTLSFVLNTSLLPAWARQSIKDPKHFVGAKLKTDILNMSTKSGEPFEAELGDSLAYKRWSLPAGTVFKGQVTKVQHSKVGRPGFLVLDVEQAQLPNGVLYEFNSQKYKPRHAKIHEKKALTIAQAALHQAPASLASLAVTLPLSIAGSVGELACIPIGVGVRMLAGATMAVMNPQSKNQAVPATVAQGALDGSGIGNLLAVLNKNPEPEYKMGDMIKLYFNPAELKSLFMAASAPASNAAVAVPLEPTGPVKLPEQLQQQPNLVKTPSEKQKETATFP